MFIQGISFFSFFTYTTRMANNFANHVLGLAGCFQHVISICFGFRTLKKQQQFS